MAPTPTIPEGFELHVGRGKDYANAALDLAEERGFARTSVKVHPQGYLVPVDADAEDEEPDEFIVEEISLPGKNASKAEISKFAEENGIDISGASNNGERLAEIEAEIERRTQKLEETGELHPIDAGADKADADDSADEDQTDDTESAGDTPKGD